MTVSVDALVSRIAELERRLSDVAEKLSNDEATLGAILTTPGQATFLGALSKLPHQTTSNANIGATGASLTNAERTAINGVINATNNFHTNAQNAHLESP